MDQIIRIGSIGGYGDQVNLRDIIIAQAASTNSNYIKQFHLPGTFAPIADFGLLQKAVALAEERKLSYHVGNILTSDTFYSADPKEKDLWKAMGILGVEMETAGLYLNAAAAGKKALGILTVSDHLYKEEELSAGERQTSFTDMMELALGLVE